MYKNGRAAKGGAVIGSPSLRSPLAVLRKISAIMREHLLTVASEMKAVAVLAFSDDLKSQVPQDSLGFFILFVGVCFDPSDMIGNVLRKIPIQLAKRAGIPICPHDLDFFHLENRIIGIILKITYDSIELHY